MKGIARFVGNHAWDEAAFAGDITENIVALIIVSASKNISYGKKTERTSNL